MVKLHVLATKQVKEETDDRWVLTKLSNKFIPDFNQGIRRFSQNVFEN